MPTAGWSHLLEPFHDPQGVVCLNNSIIWGFLSFLLFLQVMMVIWFTFIVKIVLRMFQGKPAEDVRSNSEAEDSEEEAEDVDETERPQYLEREVDAEAINWTARASAAKVSSSGGSVHFRGHTDRKELLNRIGCDKQIE